MTALATPQPRFSSAPARVPPLANGDRLTRDEFERRYRAMPNVKAELIEGVVYMASPVTHEFHGSPHSDVIGWLVVFRASTPGVDAGDNSTVRLDLDNEPQPDGVLRLVRGGESQVDQDGYLAGGPELTIEVSASSASYDLHDKFQAYRRNGIQEYVVWRVHDREVDWFYLDRGRYERLPLAENGTYQSRVFPGLWLDPAALVRRDIAEVLRRLQEGIATPEHAAFVERLQRE